MSMYLACFSYIYSSQINYTKTKDSSCSFVYGNSDEQELHREFDAPKDSSNMEQLCTVIKSPNFPSGIAIAINLANYNSIYNFIFST